jgi:hypothetical protein
MTDLDREEAKNWIISNWQTLPPEKLGKAVKRYFEKYGTPKKEDSTMEKAREVFGDQISIKQD